MATPCAVSPRPASADIQSDVHVLLEHSNRGKRSLALDLTDPDGLQLLYRLAGTCDVFLTNKLPGVRAKLKIDVDDIRAHNPKIIYARGSGQGERGPDADKGSYDSLAFWARSGVAVGATRPESDDLASPPAPAFGDSIGAMMIAGGIMGALFHRERTGEATTVDVSLLGDRSVVDGCGDGVVDAARHPVDGAARRSARGQPLGQDLSDERRLKILSLTCLQAAKYWPELCEIVGKADARHRSPVRRSAESDGQQHRRDRRARRGVRDADPGRVARRLDRFSGQWAVVQNTLEAAKDPQCDRQRIHPAVHDCCRYAVPARRRPGPVRR